MKRESEKLLEKKLGVAVKAAGGWSVKFLPFIIAGLPDRICLLPRGRMFFAEVKTTGETADPLQLAIHKKLRKLGFDVFVIDRSSQIEKILELYTLF